MFSFSLKLHILETANVKNVFFFPFLRKQPNPNPIMVAQPEDTSPLAGQRRSAQTCAVQTSEVGDRYASALPLARSTNTFETQTQPRTNEAQPLGVLLAQLVTVTVLYL